MFLASSRLFSRLLTLGVLLLNLASKAQDAPNPTLPEPIHTLHVYTNLEQVPTLILTSDHGPVSRFDVNRLRLSLDSGPIFKPTHVRVEGDDPLSLAILIDTSGSRNEYLPRIDQAIASLAPQSLQPHDRVSIYALDCALVQAPLIVAPDSAKLRKAVQLVTEPAMERSGRVLQKNHCRPSVPLWDSLQSVIADLYKQSGRRVLIAITDGVDSGSRSKWNEVRELAQVTSVAVFGVVRTLELTNSIASRMWAAHGSQMKDATIRANFESPFNSICELSGGVEVAASNKHLAVQLDWIARMVRQRYIIEYPRSSSDTAGFHSLDVSIPKSDLYIRPTGIAVPVADPKVLADPDTLPSDPNSAPQMGRRKILKPTQ